MNITPLTDFKIWKYSDTFLHQYWDNNLPVDIELIAERDLNLQLTPIPNLTNLINDNTVAILLKNKEIVFDEKCNDFRVRFSIAHEIGHFTMHNYIYQNTPDTYERWESFHAEFTEKQWILIEREANEFAGSILVPKRSLRESIATCEDSIIKAKESGIKDYKTIYPYISNNLSKKFEVSAEVIEKRLKKERIDLYEIVK